MPVAVLVCILLLDITAEESYMAFRGGLFGMGNDLLQPEVKPSETFGNHDVFNNGFRDSHRVWPANEYNFGFGSRFDFTCIHMDEDFIGDFVRPIGEMVHASDTKGSYVVYGPLDFDSHLQYLFLPSLVFHFLSLVFQGSASPLRNLRIAPSNATCELLPWYNLRSPPPSAFARVLQ